MSDVLSGVTAHTLCADLLAHRWSVGDFGLAAIRFLHEVVDISVDLSKDEWGIVLESELALLDGPDRDRPTAVHSLWKETMWSQSWSNQANQAKPIKPNWWGIGLFKNALIGSFSAAYSLPWLFSWGVGSLACQPLKSGDLRSGLVIQFSTQQW